MELAKEENLNKKLIKNSLKMFFRIAIYVVAMFFFVLSVLFFVTPKFDAKIFGFFGLTKAEERCYERVYENSKSTSDLYNLIIFEMDNDFTERELKNIEKIFLAKDYSEFCEKLDSSGVKSANGKKSLYPMVADVNSFLKGQEVSCVVKLGEASKLEGWESVLVSLIIDNLEKGSLTDTSFEVALERIFKSDKLSTNEKQNLVKLIEGSLKEGQSIEDLVKAKIDKIDAENNSDEVKKILLKNAKHKLIAGHYYYEIMLNGGVKNNNTEQILEQYKTALAEYNLLIK